VLLSYGVVMDIQIIARDGEPEYAVLPWAQYQALLKAAGVTEQPPREPTVRHAAAADQVLPGLDQLRSLREGKGIAIEALARTVGISPSYLALIESGERQPDAAIRRSLAWELTVPGWRDES
jgi:ribosome-binding protein aMBF1 (putative translation factor)